MAALLAGQGVMEVAAAYNLDEATVRNWKRKIPEERLTEVNAKKRDRIGDLLAEYVCANITTLQVQAEHARDRTWLKEQSASEVAVLHGVLADKLCRILAAAEQAEDGRESGGDPL